jgi:spore coat protein JB
MAKNELLKQLSGIGILAQDLRLFLDVNPTNEKALADFKRVTAEYRNLIATYEQNYGPLTGGHDVEGTWATNPWPWHQGGNA